MKFMAPGLWTATIRGVTTIGKIGPLTTSFVIADGSTVTTVPLSGRSPATTTIAPVISAAPTLAPTTTTTLAPATIAPTVAPTVAPQG